MAGFYCFTKVKKSLTTCSSAAQPSLRFEVDLLRSLFREADEDVAHHRGTSLRQLADRSTTPRLTGGPGTTWDRVVAIMVTTYISWEMGPPKNYA